MVSNRWPSASPRFAWVAMSVRVHDLANMMEPMLQHPKTQQTLMTQLLEHMRSSAEGGGIAMDHKEKNSNV